MGNQTHCQQCQLRWKARPVNELKRVWHEVYHSLAQSQLRCADCVGDSDSSTQNVAEGLGGGIDIDSGSDFAYTIDLPSIQHCYGFENGVVVMNLGDRGKRGFAEESVENLVSVLVVFTAGRGGGRR
ncbi:hypothetical protein Salat_2062500 [Sesamum alatum]|uniref:Uncharacterized protein n=1 Tax=Sesamum alatum TaxID=300844 RepID=A0AAE1XZX7_9LAMI|nr:hypothetical protein Salat_2062500 [Sesamum alatum]